MNFIEEKSVHLVFIGIGNDGRSDAEKPYLAIHSVKDKEIDRDQDKELPEGWNFGGRLNRRRNISEFVPLQTLSDNPEERELAYTLVTQGLKEIDEIPATGSQNFVFGFSFAGSKKFYMINESEFYGLDFPIITSFNLTAKSETSNDFLNPDEPLVIMILSARDVRTITKSEFEKLQKEGYVIRKREDGKFTLEKDSA